MKYLIALRNALKDVHIIGRIDKSREIYRLFGLYRLLSIAFFICTSRTFYPFEIWLFGYSFYVGIRWSDTTEKCLSWIWSEIKLDLRGMR
jgi:hypothetical protein